MKRRLVLPATGLMLVALLAYACNSGMPYTLHRYTAMWFFWLASAAYIMGFLL